MSYNTPFSIKDAECANILLDLIKPCMYERTDIYEFAEIAITKLKKLCRNWKVQWKHILGENEVCFEGTLEWPYNHVIPYDLFPKLARYMKRYAVVSTVDFYFPSDVCVGLRCTISSPNDDTPISVWCANCGNRWDGNAQCNCSDSE